MYLTQTYKNAFTEVYKILNYIGDEDYSKIPEDIISVIEENRSKDYQYEINEDVDIFNQTMLPETKAILFNFFRDYWATPEQKEKIKMWQREERQKIEERKKMKYSTDNIFKNGSSSVRSSVNNQNMEYTTATEKTFLVKLEKESIWKKIINKIKSFLKL